MKSMKASKTQSFLKANLFPKKTISNLLSWIT